MIEISFENDIAEQVIDTLEDKLADLGKLCTTLLKAKQHDAVAYVKQDIAQFNTLKADIEEKYSDSMAKKP